MALREQHEAFQRLEEEVMACRRCPRLVAYRERVAAEKRRAYRHENYWGRPVPGFGDRTARLVVIGLAPAAHGANRTGRMFTGDRSGDFLYARLFEAGLASSPLSVARDDGLTLSGVYITAIVRCAPPENRPSPNEVANCLPFLERELDLIDTGKVYLCLGQMAWATVRRVLRRRGAPLARVPFGHGAEDLLPPPWPALVASYHPSQQNTQTGRLTADMFARVLGRALALVAERLPPRPEGAGSRRSL